MTTLTDQENLKLFEGLPPLATEAQRREALRKADVSLRIEGLERDAESAPIFEAWVLGKLTEQEAIAALLRYQ